LKCDICGEPLPEESTFHHLKSKHPSYFRLQVRLFFIISIGAVLSAVPLAIVRTANPEAQQIVNWIGFPAQAVGLGVLILFIRVLLARKRASLKVNATSFEGLSQKETKE